LTQTGPGAILAASKQTQRGARLPPGRRLAGRTNKGKLMRGIVFLAVFIAIIAGFWKVFEKAGKPGWAAIIPIYNVIVLLEIAGKPLWWIIMFFIPVVNLIAAILVGLGVAKNFGKSDLFGIGLGLLGFIFYPVLGFGDAQYHAAPAPATT
jgi:hypothetical protein